ncbi:GNAT family N-acetyltransferase [Subdoligranulum variabile]|uniref:GNAT family N-acetyltransferase n=1 Tax=Subdoligranulum variabile TaxID=214851 RepID=UPI0026E92BE2|nr:GNAT family N-acetyltransferase [Subdoligranulum variabile]
MSTENLLGPAASLAADRLPYTPAWVYLLRCADGSLYAGWTNDLARRLHAHQTGAGGAKYTKSHGKAAVRLAYAERCADKSAALKREAALKKLPKAEKEALAADWAARSRLTVRMATPDDADDVVTLYNWYVTHGTQTFQYELSTVEDYRQNIAEVLEKAPFLVAYTADGRLAGYACAHPWHTRRAFAWDVETTVYCAPDVLGQGTGRKLYTALLELLRRQGYHNAFALITRPNPQSDAFHKALGFTRYGVEKNSGYKFGRWLDLGYWAYELNPPADPPQPVRLQLDTAEVEAVLRGVNGV